MAVFPLQSVAVTVKVLFPSTSGIFETLHDVVPEAVPLDDELLNIHITVETSSLSLAVPDIVIVPDVVVYVLPVVGDVMAIEGAIPSE